MGDFTFRAPEVAAPAGPIAPFPDPLLLNDWGEVLVPHAFFPWSHTSLPLSRGLAMGWAPFAAVDGALIAFFGGNPDAPTDESIAVSLSRDGLRALIRDLQAIDQQLEGEA
ncbi:MAG TPA: hypothetical protein VJM09_05190 [Sphingobium sp.]|nr:hypothetical protein [Sphingobium sp.]